LGTGGGGAFKNNIKLISKLNKKKGTEQDRDVQKL